MNLSRLAVPRALIFLLTTVKMVIVLFTYMIEKAALRSLVMVKLKAEAETVVEG